MREKRRKERKEPGGWVKVKSREGSEKAVTIVQARHDGSLNTVRYS